MQKLEFNWTKVAYQELLQHPYANRKIQLAQYTVWYVLQHRRRKTVGMRITEYGLEVAAPNRTTYAEIERILHNKSAWIVRHLTTAMQQFHAAQKQCPIWKDGVYIPWQDGMLQVRLVLDTVDFAVPISLKPRMRTQIVQSARLQKIAVDAAQKPETKALYILWIKVSKTIDADTLRILVQSWMQQQAIQIFSARLDYYAQLLGVQYQKLKISSAKTRWGSASSRGTICLHWRLLQMPSTVLDYVVVHELAHLHEMNHSARFWAWVASILPDYKKRRLLLKNSQLPPW